VRFLVVRDPLKLVPDLGFGKIGKSLVCGSRERLEKGRFFRKFVPMAKCRVKNDCFVGHRTAETQNRSSAWPVIWKVECPIKRSIIYGPETRILGFWQVSGVWLYGCITWLVGYTCARYLLYGCTVARYLLYGCTCARYLDCLDACRLYMCTLPWLSWCL